MLKKLTLPTIFLCFFLATTPATAIITTDFPLANYDQTIEHWINPSDPDYDQPLISTFDQEKYLKDYYKHYFATDGDALSPWCSNYVEKIIKQQLPSSLENFSKQSLLNKYNYVSEIEKIVDNMNLNQFEGIIKYDQNNRAIAVNNLNARSIPTDKNFFDTSVTPAQGYPFDALQESAIWVGTPVYIIGETLDGKWVLVLTPHYMAWVKKDGVAKASEDFINTWRDSAKENMVAIAKTNVKITDPAYQSQLDAYIGTVFPAQSPDNDVRDEKIGILIPYADKNHNAQITSAMLSHEDAVIMPLQATPHNFSKIISSLKSRPYGWGNIDFLNDCSGELQSLYTPFGIWLPRNSTQQISIANVDDLSSKSTEERLKYLMDKGKKFTTLVNIGGHIMLYIGTFPNPNSHGSDKDMAMTYQNTWGLKSVDNSYRLKIGKSCFFPLLTKYPEDHNLRSFAEGTCFKVRFLNQGDCVKPELKSELHH